jgi:hypothetical protein
VKLGAQLPPRLSTTTKEDAVSAVTTYKRLHIPTAWLIVLIVALAFIAIELAVIGWQRSAAVAPTVPVAVPGQVAPTPIAPTMSGDLAPIVVA